MKFTSSPTNAHRFRRFLLTLTLLLALVTPSLTLAQSNGEGEGQRIFLPLVAGGNVTEQVNVVSASVNLTTLGSAYTQDFNTLASSGQSTIVPTDWAFAESGTNANITYTVGTGSSTTGDTYSFGAASNIERALGGLLSGSVNPTIGANFTNNTGSTITQLTIAYTGEQWRLGTLARLDKLDFQLSTNATSLNTGVWTDYNTLDFTAPITGPTTGAVDGNAAANRSAINSVLPGLNIANGTTFWIRWIDLNASGADDGLAVDDFSLTPDATLVPTNPLGTGTANPDLVVAGDTTVLTVSVTPGSNPPSSGLAVTCDLSAIGGSATQSFFDDGSNGDATPADNIFSYQATVASNTSNGAKNLACTIIDAEARSGGAIITLTVQAPVVVAALVINEIDYDQPSTDAAEFVEIRNNDLASVDLTGYTIQLINGNGGGATQYQLFALPALTLAPGDYFVLCGNTANVANCDLDVTPDTDLIQNGAPDAVALRFGTTIVDAVSYEGNSAAPYTEGSGVGVLDDPALTGAGISRCTDGSDTNQNSVDFSFHKITPGAANACLPIVVINEIDYDQPSTDAAEFIEIRNNDILSFSLGSFSLELVNGNAAGVTIYQTINLNNVTLTPGDYYVVCANAATVANCDQDVAPDTNLLQNGAPDAVGLRYNGLLIDAVSYEGNSGSPYVEGSAVGLIDDGVNVNQGLSRCPDGVDSNQNNVDHSLHSITPGAASDCALDVAPTVVSTNPTNGTMDAPTGSNIVINFSENVTVNGSWFDITCTTSGSHTALVSGGPQSYTLNPDVNFTSGESCTVTIFAANVSDQDGTPNSMAANYLFSFTAIDVCVLSYTPIYAIQGSGATALITGTVTTQGIVVGDYEGTAPTFRGFYIQDVNGDSNASTSDGIFVFNGDNNSVSLGDLVRVTGTAGEFQDQTQLSNVTAIAICGGGSVLPVNVTLPVPSATYLEQVEGMLVRFPQTLYVSEHFQLGRFGQVLLSANGRLQQPTNVVAPGAPALALQAQNDLNKILLDDALQNQNADPIVFGRDGQPLSASNTLRGGDTASAIVGLLSYTWAGNAASPNAYRVRPINALGGSINFVEGNPRPLNAPTVTGRLRVAGMNLLNFFNTFTGCTGGFGGTAMDCRGANTQVEFDRQWPKTVTAILGTQADVIGVIEIENDGYGPTSAIQFLVDQLNAATTAGTYAFIDVDAAVAQTNALGTDAIKVGFIYKPAKVSAVGTTAALNTETFVNGGDAAPRSRPALAQAFAEVSSGSVFVVSVNHLKSKGSACTAPDAGDGQGNCNIVRTNAAAELVSWLENDDPTGMGDPDVLILGDLNAYAMEDPIMAITGAGYTNLIHAFGGDEAYSYVFDGQWGYLDHALSNAALTPQVSSVADWHVNADEPSVLDYNTDFKSAGQIISLYAPDEFRIADHDPVLVDLNLSNNPPVAAPTQTPAANGNGWNNSAVTVNWNWSDDGNRIDAANCTTSSTSSGEGTIVLTAACKDLAGSEGSASYTVKVDQTAPVVTVTGVSNGASYAYGSVPAAGCDTQDATSGVASAAAVNVTGGNIDGIGSFTAICSSATDNADNTSSPVSVTYTVLAPGTLVDSCGGYTVYRNGSVYIAPRWTGTIRVGSNSNNTLNGTAAGDLMLGLGGNDLINGQGGDDLICGGGGVDLLSGFGGKDLLDGGIGNDVLNGGAGDFDELTAGDGNDTLLDGDGVGLAQGGAGNDLITIVLRNGWRDGSGQPRFTVLTAGYGNDIVSLTSLNSTQFFFDISGDERDVPASALEGTNDRLVLVGVVDLTSLISKFEQRLIISATSELTILSEAAGAEYLTEPVGEEGAEVGPTQQIFLPMVAR